ncbi:amino acid adenylation domain protein [Rippkaea orientalis PCC 8801]|uniref:Amino acid adenylation domain protein n=1 Tax=Rippkaea orientalis (strain PCC 8801 / RF-1) TaxID=41431 RepID=B7JWG5_RIPO1|nr:non-ribosomal peptide synthetase [Rippkaea orientalis]ACK67010.1 amino acid adenylation domain protein [Rippkaea orientalis PCC 8801]
MNTEQKFTSINSYLQTFNPEDVFIFPTSSAQARLWFLAELEPDSSVYNEQVIIELQGQFNQTALEKSFNEIVRRHEILRTFFTTDQGKPVQVILPYLSLEFPVIDLSHLSSKEQETIIKKHTINEGQKPFDLTQIPLIRIIVLKLHPQKHLLLITLHHIIIDGWSGGVLMKELGLLYEAFCHKKSSPLPPLSIQYADFTIWQNDYLQSEKLKQQLSYWQEKLTSIPPLLELPTDYHRPPMQTFKGQCQTFELTPELSYQLKQLSQKNGSTLFMTLLAAWTILLSRYSRQQDIVIGSPIANRNRVEIEPLIGFFANTLVLRTNLSGNPAFSELLNQVRQVCLEAYTHQDIPFEKLVEALQPERNLSQTPLFQVMFVLQNANYEELKLSDFTFRFLPKENTIAKFDLTLSMLESQEKLTGEIEYNQDLFNCSTIARMAEHFLGLLGEIVRNPQKPITELSFLTESEQNQLLIHWNNTKVEYSKTQCIHQLFEEQVIRTPDAIALEFEGITLTYFELNQKANQLGHYLQKLGVKPDSLVGICVKRSPDMIIGVLGILKAGGAYIPIDPTYPKERIAYLLEDAQIDLLLSQAGLSTELPQSQTTVINLDENWSEIALESCNNVLSQVTPQNLVYIIYTSGSTGKPKGVMIEHQSLVNFTKTAIDIYNITPKDRVLQFASISFDAAAEEIYPCLSSGATLVLRTDEMIASTDTFFHQCQAKQLTVLDLPTAYWQQITTELENANQKLPNTLRLVIIGGERAIPEKIETWHKKVGDFPKLLNTYGPTESTVVATVYPLISSVKIKQEVPIGKPINNVTTYILDPNLQLVPIGVPGELYLGGMGLAKGYLNRPKLTAEKFIINPFNTSERLYKTGDLVRYLSDGNIEFLGRIDNQVKIRGFRIELGEIESILSRHPEIKETVVIVREDTPAQKRLVAYITSDKIASQTDNNWYETLKHYLKTSLPDYMIPQSFVLLENLPLTVNGKIDYSRLPCPDYSLINSDKNYIAPRTPIEATLAQIWSDILKHQNISINHNFFDLGGDSIISIQVIARAKQAGIKIKPKQLFEYQTIAELAAVAKVDQSSLNEQELITGSVLLTPIQHWFFNQNLVESHHWNQGILLEVEADININDLQEAIKHLLIYHDGLRLRFEFVNNHWQQIYSHPQDSIPLEIVDLSNVSPNQQSNLIKQKANECQSSLDLSQGLVFKSLFFYLGNNQPNRLLIIIHHLVIDGVSWRILLEDLVTVYQQLHQEQTIQLPPKTTSLQKWSQKLYDYAQSEKIQKELDYWLTLSQIKINSIPVDYQVSLTQNTVASTQQITVGLNAEKTRALLQDVSAVYNTQINDLLLTALVQSFAGWTGDFSLLIELEGHGREDLFDDVDLSRTIGWFTSVFTVLLTLPQSQDLGDRLKSVKEQLRRIPQKGINYGILQYLTDNQLIKSQLNQMPKPQISFNYLGQFYQQISSPPLLNLAQEPIGFMRSPKGINHHLIEINAWIMSEKLEITWSYSENLYYKNTIEKLAKGYKTALEKLISYCQSAEAGGYTPSDFPEANLSQEELDQLFLEFS